MINAAWTVVACSCGAALMSVIAACIEQDLGHITSAVSISALAFVVYISEMTIITQRRELEQWRKLHGHSRP